MSICHQKIKSLELNILNSLAVGVIITNGSVKIFDKQNNYRPGSRAVWNFTIRDSEEDTINVTVWGSEPYIIGLSERLTIGSVIEVINAKVQSYTPFGKNEKFMPTTNGPHQLSVNEGTALVQLHESPDKAVYEALLHVPMKNVSNVKSLTDVLMNLEALQGEYVDILVAVMFVSDSRNVMTRDGRALVCRDFQVTDGTTSETVSFILWENKWIQRSGKWEPKKTVLYMSDVYIGADKFKKKTTMMVSFKTVITENPSVPEAEEVRNSVRDTELESLPQDPFVLPKPEDIKSVMTVKEITEKLNKKPTTGDRVQFVTILYASVTDISMDSAHSDFLITRCALCKRTVPENQDSCMNLECPCGTGRRAPTNVHQFYLKVNLRDDTGYLIGCRLTGPPAENALSCTIEEFKSMTQTQRAELKWRLILESCDVRIQVLGPTPTFSRVVYNILSLNRVREVKEQ